jgi:phospholipid/cholesterol/gamma-HCH transport system permease protein
MSEAARGSRTNPGQAPVPGRLHISQAAGAMQLRATGDWTLTHYIALEQTISGLEFEGEPPVDLDDLGAVDTAGATLLARLLGAERLRSLAESTPALSAERRALLQAVGEAVHRDPGERRASTNIVVELLGHMGRVLEDVWKQILMLLGFMGLTLATFWTCLFRPRSWRITALVSQMEETGLNAVPIVALLTFAVGAVIAYLGATVLSDFGATIYTIDLVAYSFLREFGVLITAIVLAGRTASAFTAHIGSMKANEELDALRAQGLDPVELLVLPRVMALILVLPMLTFIAMLSGLAGGGWLRSRCWIFRPNASSPS